MKTFTEPSIYPKRPKSENAPAELSKQWRVWFRFFHAGKWHQVSRKCDLNQIEDFKERLASAKELQRELSRRLRVGWNPITGTYPSKTIEEIQLEELQCMTFDQALDWAYNQKKDKWKPKSASDYRSKIKYLKQAAIDKPIKDYRKFDYKMVLSKVEKDRNLSPAGYNIYRDYLSTLIGVLAEWDIIESNPIEYIKCQSAPKKKAHRPPTQDQRIAIVSKIKDLNRPYYRFLAILYGCGIRPVEITRLKIEYLHKMEGVFRLPPDITKNKCEADVAIPNWVMDLLMEMKLEKYPRGYYIFGGKPNLFMPGKNKMGVNTCRYHWDKIVKDEKGLNMKVNQYSFKKMSADDLVKLQRREGASNLLALAKMQFRHSSDSQTAVYTDEDKAIMSEIIKEKMPEL